MFFTNKKPKALTFDQRLSNLGEFGFQVQQLGSGKARVSREGCAVIVEDSGGEEVNAGKPGIAVGEEIGVLVHGGYQMFFRTPSGVVRPALAPQLKSLHAFSEDLREGLGITSLYNQSLGSTCTGHMYDRVRHREGGAHHDAWKK